MKKNILIIACLCTALVHAMETCSLREITKNSLSMLSHGTKINLIKGSIFDPSSPMDITVVGVNQQNMLKKRSFQPKKVGKIYTFTCSIIFEKNKDDDSASDDDTYKPYPISVDQLKTGYFEQNLKFGHHKIIKSTILNIAEPCINQLWELNTEGELIKNFEYCANRPISNEKNRVIHFGDEAIQEASNDLVICYEKILAKGLEVFPCCKSKSIAIPTLSADTGFPRELAAPIAVKTVLEWVKNNSQTCDLLGHKPRRYDTINFVVKKRSDFALYKKLLIQRCIFPKNICLLYCAHNDNELYYHTCHMK